MSQLNVPIDSICSFHFQLKQLKKTQKLNEIVQLHFAIRKCSPTNAKLVLMHNIIYVIEIEVERKISRTKNANIDEKS